MIKKLLSWLQGSSAGAQKAAAPASAQGADAPPARWLSKDDAGNPFVLDGFDCLQFVSSMISTTQDPNVATSFTSLRSADGQSMRGALPENTEEIPCALSYPHSGETGDGVLFKASVMEEKWDIYLYDSRLYFCRSWTGALACVAEISLGNGALQVTRIWESRSEEAVLSVRQVDYLIKSHLYKRRVPHPLPELLSRDPATVALYSFSQYGKLCCFGSFEDTLAADVLKKRPPAAG